MRIVFLGTPAFAVPSLAALCDSSIEVAAVFTQPDRPAGRGRKRTPPPVKMAAEARGLAVHQPEKIRARDIAPFSPAAAVVVAYGQILSRKFLEALPLGAWNLHASLLPRWRGAAPIQRALLAGDDECGVSVMRIVPELDAGPFIAQRAIPIGPADTSEDLHDRLAETGAALMAESLLRLESGAAAETPQDPSRVTYAGKLSKEEAPLDWRLPAGELDRRVRGLRPWPVAETAWPGIEGGPVRIWRAALLSGESVSDESAGAPPGTVLGTEGGLRVAAGGGALLLLEIQPPGGRRMAAADFLRGHPLPEGALLGRVS